MLTKFCLVASDLINTININALSILTYSFVVLKWSNTKPEEDPKDNKHHAYQFQQPSSKILNITLTKLIEFFYGKAQTSELEPTRH